MGSHFKRVPTGNVRALRRSLGMGQREFWGRLGVTQSGGSRYEAGRSVPAPVAILLRAAYGSVRQSQRAVERLLSRRWSLP